MCILPLSENGLEKYRLFKKWEQFKILLLFMDHPVFATGNLEAALEPYYVLRFCLMVFHSCDYLPTAENKCLKTAGKCFLEVMSFVTCLGSKCSD